MELLQRGQGKESRVGDSLIHVRPMASGEIRRNGQAGCIQEWLFGGTKRSFPMLVLVHNSRLLIPADVRGYSHVVRTSFNMICPETVVD